MFSKPLEPKLPLLEKKEATREEKTEDNITMRSKSSISNTSHLNDKKGALFGESKEGESKAGGLFGNKVQEGSGFFGGSSKIKPS